MSHFLATLFGVFLGMSFFSTLHIGAVNDAVQKCTTNGGVKFIHNSVLLQPGTTCINGAKFELVIGRAP